ncbi:hypothetical protein C7H75_14120 [Prescottella equi]|nr:hypothetical protein C7H75_14120 [Prescottella equi]
MDRLSPTADAAATLLEWKLSGSRRQNCSTRPVSRSDRACPTPSSPPSTNACPRRPRIVEYLRNELPAGRGRKSLSPITVRVPYWSRFVESASSAESV